MKHSESITKLATALVKAQAEMPEIPMDGTNPHFHSKFSTLGAVIKGTRPIFAKHGISILQLPCSGNGEVGLTTRIIHESGEWVEETAMMSVKDSANPGQELGKLVTYLRRYSLAAAAGVYSDEDVDNEGATKQEKKGTKAPEQSQQKAQNSGSGISDERWATFTKLVETAASQGIELPEYKREKLNAGQIEGATKYIEAKIEKAGK